MTKFDGDIDVFTMVHGGSMYHVTLQFVEQVIRDAGCILHSKTPFQIIDKVGLLKPQDESLEMTKDFILNTFRDPVVATLSDQSSFVFGHGFDLTI